MIFSYLLVCYNFCVFILFIYYYIKMHMFKCFNFHGKRIADLPWAKVCSDLCSGFPPLLGELVFY